MVTVRSPTPDNLTLYIPSPGTWALWQPVPGSLYFPAQVIKCDSTLKEAAIEVFSDVVPLPHVNRFVQSFHECYNVMGGILDIDLVPDQV